MEADVLRSTMRREKMKDRKRTGARIVRERRESRNSWWGVEGGGEEGEEAGLVDIVKAGCADAGVGAGAGACQWMADPVNMEISVVSIL